MLVNNAGGGGPKPFDMPMETFVWAYELNVFSVFRLCQLCAPHIAAAGGGAILNISSMSAREHQRADGVLRLVEGGAQSPDPQHGVSTSGPQKIRVNAIAPGAIRTARPGAAY